MKTEKERQQAVLDNRAEQLNPTSDKYYRSRGLPEEQARNQAMRTSREYARKAKEG